MKRSHSSSKNKRPVQRKIKRSSLIKKLDAVTSLLVRLSHAKKDGMLQCYTCNKLLTIKQAQCGHYISRSIRILRWDLRNLRPQCFGCNVMQGGQIITFRENLVEEIGEKEVLELESKRHELFSPSNEWLLEQIALFAAKLDLLNKSS